MASRLDELFESLQPPPRDAETGQAAYSAVPIEGQGRWFIGKDSDAHACLLFQLATTDANRHAPIRLESLDVQFGVRCRLRRADSADRVDRVFAVILCRLLDPDTVRYFLTAGEAVLRLAGPSPTPSELARIVQRLAALFRHLERPATKPVNGLFGELFMIWRSESPADALFAWRLDADARFDFSVADGRLEVKTTSGRTRSHTCSYDQCNPPRGTTALAASLFVERSPGGASLEAILAEIEDSVNGNAELVLKLQEVTAATLGSSLHESLKARFDVELAESSLEIHDLRAVPALRDALAMGVSDVHFRSDFSLSQPVSCADLDVGHALLRLLPRGWR